MNIKSKLFGLLNILARIFGLTFTAIGIYFVARGIFYIIQPEAAESIDTLGFSPAFRPLVIACVSLVVGVHFIRGEAHRPDIAKGKQPGHPTDGRTHSWWTGERLNGQADRGSDA